MNGSSFFWECVAIAILFFLFDGDPDVYDKLKEAEKNGKKL